MALNIFKMTLGQDRVSSFRLDLGQLSRSP
jgi:hypothetical protein